MTRLLPVGFHKVREALHGFIEDLDPRQVDDAEMIRLRPVEAAAPRDQDVLLVQKVQRELLIVPDAEALHIHFREDVEGGLRLDDGNAGDILQRIVNKLALLVDAAARNEVGLDTLIAAEGRLHDGLGRNIGAQPHIAEHVEPLDAG